MAEIRDIWLHAHNMLRSARQIVNENLRPLNLTSAEGNILLHLLTQGREMRQERLADELDVSRPAISRTIHSLEGKGFLTREADPEDRRAYRVRLTARALALGPEIERAYDRLYTLAVQGISPEELEQFTALFARISENLARAGTQPGPEAPHAA